MENLYLKHGLISRTYSIKPLIMASIFGSKNTEESWALLDDLALYDNESWNDPRDFAKPVKAISLPQDVLSTSDHRLIELKNQVQRLMEAHLAPMQPTQVNKITTSCEICSGPHDTQYCMEDPEQSFVEYASSHTDEAGGKCDSHDDEPTESEEEEKDSPENTNTNPSASPDPSVSFITEKVRKLNSFFESLGFVPQLSGTELVCTKGDDGDVMFIEIVQKHDNSRDKEPEAGEQEVEYFDTFPTRSELMYHKKFHLCPRLHIIDPRLSQVVLGKPFVDISNMTHDPPEGVVRFTNRTDEIAYKMPHNIEQYNLLSNLEKEHTKSVYLRNEKDRKRGVEYMMNKILGFYKEFLELGPECVTGMDDEGEVTLYLMRRSLEVLRKFHWTILGGRFNQKAHLLEEKQISRVEDLFDTVREDGVADIKRRRRDLYGDVIDNRIIKKRIHVCVEHVMPSRCTEEFKQRVKKNDQLKVEAKARGEITAVYCLMNARKRRRSSTKHIDLVGAVGLSQGVLSVKTIREVGRIDDDILLTIKDDILREKLFNVNLLIDYKAFYIDNDHFKEKSSGNTTTNVDFSRYDSFIFDLSNDHFPPADRSDSHHEEFADELTHIMSFPDLKCFRFKIEPDPGDLTSIDLVIRKNVSTTNVNVPLGDDQSPLFAYVYSVIHQPPHEKTIGELLVEEQAANIDQSPPQEMSIQDMKHLKQHYLDEMKSLINDLHIKNYRNERIDIQYRRECEIKIDELKKNFNVMSIEIRKKEKELLQQEQAAYDFSDSNNDSTSTDDDSFSIYNIDYVEASPPHSELVSLEEVKDFHPEDGELDDDVLREKLSKINLLIAKIEALKDNPTLSSDFVTKSPSTSPNSFLEETNISYNSLPDEPDSGDFTMDSFVIKSLIPVEDGDSFLENFETTTELETFKFDIEEKNSGSTTIHANISLSDLECVYFKSDPDPGDLTSIDPEIRENVSSTTNVNLPFEDDQSPLFAYVVWIFLSFPTIAWIVKNRARRAILDGSLGFLELIGKHIGADDEEISEGGIPRVIVLGYVRLSIQPDEDDDDGNSSRDDANDEDEDDEDEEEEEHLASTDSTIVIPVDEHVFLHKGTEPVTPPPSTDITIGARITVRPQTSISLPPEAKVERLLAITTPSPSPPISLSPPSAGERLARCIAPPALIDAVTTVLPSPPLPPLPPSLYIPPPVDHRDDIPESEQPPHKRLYLSTLGSRYEVKESSTTRPTRGRGIGYGFVSTVDAEERVTELAELYKHDTQDLYALPEDAQDSRSRISQRVDMDSRRVNLLMGDRMTLQEIVTHQELQTHHDHVYAHETHLQAHQTQLQLQGTLIQTQHQTHMVETLRVIRDMRREMSDIQAELLSLREQQMRARQPGPEARIPNHQDASGDVGSHI
ncbi:retrotransposon ORF1 [Tanacetum coccineum]